MPTQRKLSLLGLSLIILAPGFVGLASSRPGAGFPPPGPPSTGPRPDPRPDPGLSPGLSPGLARRLVEECRKRVEQRGEELERARLEVYNASGPALEAARLKVAAGEAALAAAQAQLERWQAALASLGPLPADPPREEAREAKAPKETKETKVVMGTQGAGRSRVGSSPTRGLPRRDHPFFTWSKRQAPGDVFRFTTAMEGWASFPEKLVLSESGSLFWWDREGRAIRRLDPDGRHGVHFQAEGTLSRAEVWDWSAGPDGVCLLADLHSRGHRGLHFLYAPRDLLDTTHPPVMAPLGSVVTEPPLALVPPFAAGSGREAVGVLPRHLLFFTVGDPQRTRTVVRKQVAGPDLGPGHGRIPALPRGGPVRGGGPAFQGKGAAPRSSPGRDRPRG